MRPGRPPDSHRAAGLDQVPRVPPAVGCGGRARPAAHDDAAEAADGPHRETRPRIRRERSVEPRPGNRRGVQRLGGIAGDARAPGCVPRLVRDMTAKRAAKDAEAAVGAGVDDIRHRAAPRRASRATNATRLCPPPRRRAIARYGHRRRVVTVCARSRVGARLGTRARSLARPCPGAFVRIEHSGSAAAPGHVATPTIDILAAVTSPEGIDTRVKRLCERGDTTSRQFNATLEARRLMRGKDGQRTHHLHTVSHDGHTRT